MKEILLSNGLVTLVDDADYMELSKRRWHASIRRDRYYAICNAYVNGKWTMLKMHRLIVDAPPGSQVDHMNHDTLDNRRANLRLCTNADNQHNRKWCPGHSSVFKGVTWHRETRKWRSQITVAYKNHHLGLYTMEEDAAIAYDEAARKAFGRYAALNFPDGHRRMVLRLQLADLRDIERECNAAASQ